MSAIQIALLVVYDLALCGLALYGWHRLALVLRRPRRSVPLPPLPPSAAPIVTVQLPVYNELNVLERLVAAACALRWPKERLEIQILDDSTDATSALARQLASRWRRRGFDVVCLQRGHRLGFKAGALAHGLERARGEFLALFDADFVPPPDFLERTIPCFDAPDVGMVQARWSHLNRGHSPLTRAQALMLDAHFRIEQAARAAAGWWFNFNGTAGVFRRACIEEAGGWRSDTLTEDLDISYRAQMVGWRFVFLEDVGCPAELPVEMNALRSQQHRWAKGSIQTARRILPRLLHGRAPWRAKVESAFHLTNNAAYLLLLATSLLLIPSLIARQRLGWTSTLPDLLVFGFGSGSFALFGLASQRREGRPFVSSLLEVVCVMALGAGLALNNGLAVVEALVGLPSEFRRTPKLRITDGAGGRESHAAGRRIYRGAPSRLMGAETALASIFACAMVWAAREGLYGSIPFLALFASGYGWVSALTFVQQPAGALRCPSPGPSSAPSPSKP